MQVGVEDGGHRTILFVLGMPCGGPHSSASGRLPDRLKPACAGLDGSEEPLPLAATQGAEGAPGGYRLFLKAIQAATAVKLTTMATTIQKPCG